MMHHVLQRRVVPGNRAPWGDLDLLHHLRPTRLLLCTCVGSSVCAVCVQVACVRWHPCASCLPGLLPYSDRESTSTNTVVSHPHLSTLYADEGHSPEPSKIDDPHFTMHRAALAMNEAVAMHRHVSGAHAHGQRVRGRAGWTVGHSSVLAICGAEGGLRRREQSEQTTIERHRHLNPQKIVCILPTEEGVLLLILRLVRFCCLLVLV